MIGFVTAKRGHEEERDGARCEKGKDPAIARARKIDPDVKLAVEMEGAAFSPALQERPNNREETTDKEKPRGNEVGEDADVRVRTRGKQIDREQEEEGEDGARREQQPYPTGPIPKMPLEG